VADVSDDAYEQWFVRRGVPHFIVDYSAGRDIWTRAVPLLLAAYVLGGLNALDLADRSWRWNVATAGLVIAVLAAAWAITAAVRHRPMWSLPTQVGTAELAVFLVGPALPPLFVRQLGDALQSLLEGIAVLAAIYFATSYAVGPLARWGAQRARAQVGLFLNTIVRVLPLLLLVITFLFVNAEVWQMAGRLYGWAYWVVAAMFVVLGIVFLLSRMPTLVAGAHSLDMTSDLVRDLLVDTPVTGDASGDPATGRGTPPPLSGREHANLVLLAFFGQAIQITLVAIVVFVFFVAFGTLAIPADTVAVWTTHPPHVLWGSGKVVTEELLRVAGFLSAFTGMYFTVVLSTDATYREEFAEDVTPDIQRVLLVRAVYRARCSALISPATDR
jgi:hypothetical protein